MDNKQTALRRGLMVFVGLAVLTAVEYALAVFTGLYALLVVTALAKAGLVAWCYMHIRKVFAPDGGEE